MEDIKKDCISADTGKPGHRWGLSADNLLPYFFTKVKFDYMSKTISFKYLDVVTNGCNQDAFVWVDNIRKGILPDEKMTFVTVDDCGNETSKFTFSGLQVIVHESIEFDYAKSEPSTQNVVVKYDSVSYIDYSNPERYRRKYWTLEFEDKQSIPVKIPEFSLEETEINFLNSKTFVGGKPGWNKISLEIKEEFYGQLIKAFDINDLTVTMKNKIKLNFHEDTKILETWELGRTFISGGKIHPTENKYTFDLRFDNAIYKSHLEN